MHDGMQGADRDGAIRGVPCCESCGTRRVFEAQLMPPLVYYLEQLDAAAAAAAAAGDTDAAAAGGGTEGGEQDEAKRAVALGREVVLAWATAAVFVCEQCCAPKVSTETTFAKEIVLVAYE
jgi:hypothetical protein